LLSGKTRKCFTACIGQPEVERVLPGQNCSPPADRTEQGPGVAGEECSDCEYRGRDLWLNDRVVGEKPRKRLHYPTSDGSDKTLLDKRKFEFIILV
jgi:hypothetical protein